jgi:hypothetical protein
MDRPLLTREAPQWPPYFSEESFPSLVSPHCYNQIMTQNLLLPSFSNGPPILVKIALPYPIPSTVLWKSRKGQPHPKEHTHQTHSGTSTGLGPTTTFSSPPYPSPPSKPSTNQHFWGHVWPPTSNTPTTPSNILSLVFFFTNLREDNALDSPRHPPPKIHLLFLLQTLTHYRSENGFITRDQYPLFLYNLLGRAH